MEVSAGQHLVYKLSDPRDRIIRYVGVTTEKNFDTLQRFHAHMRLSETNAELREWMLSLVKLGIKPLQERVSAHLSEEEARIREARLICELYREGVPLFNKARPSKRAMAHLDDRVVALFACDGWPRVTSSV